MTPDPFDPAALRLTSTNGAAIADRKPIRPPRHKPGGRFLKGPIPWDWLDAAGRLPGKSLRVGLFLWREAGCQNRRAVRCCLGSLGMCRQAARRALDLLESAGLVTVRREPGRCVTVELLDAPNSAEG